MGVRAQVATAYTEFDASLADLKEEILLRSPHEVAEFSRVRRKPVDATDLAVPRTAYGRSSRPAPSFDLIEAPPGAGLVHVYLIDSDDTRRSAVHKLLSGRSNMVVRAYRTRAVFLAEAELLDEGCIILSDESDDTQASESDVILDFIRSLRDEGRFACILLTSERHMRLAINAMKAGATDCLPVPFAPEAVLEPLEEALKTQRTARAMNDASTEARDQIGRLTARERDVRQGLLYGKSNKMIAIDLGISPRTVEIYRAHLMEKLGTHSLSETLRIAFTAGMA